MTRFVQFDIPKTGQGRRWVVGVRAASGCREARATLVAASGNGLDVTPAIVGAMDVDIPHATSGLLVGKAECPAVALATVQAELADVEAPLVLDLLAELGIAPSRVLALAVDDPGLWHFRQGEFIGYQGLCAPARLAEATGLNVIDAFAARDLARGGQGGPLAAIPEWLLLRDPNKNRLLVGLRRTIRVTYLPATTAERAADRVLSFHAGPGTALLDHLAERLTSGEHRFDPGGRLAVQGCCIPELLEHWLSDSYFDRPVPRWHPRGVSPARYLSDSLQMAVQSGWSVRDLLCTATHFLAQSVVLAKTRRLPEDADVDEVVVTGGGQHNGMLLHELSQGLQLPLVRASELGAPDQALDAAAVAVLALLAIDQVPANPTAITGTEVPRILGRWTPGSPQQWQRLLNAIAGAEPAVRPLRSAV